MDRGRPECLSRFLLDCLYTSNYARALLRKNLNFHEALYLLLPYSLHADHLHLHVHISTLHADHLLLHVHTYHKRMDMYGHEG
jgi:hypothetical protein